MTSLEALIAEGPLPVRGFIAGHSSAGKTGSLAVLANSGWNLRILDFDNNPEPLIANVVPEARSRVTIQALEDDYTTGDQRIEIQGAPRAWPTALRLLVNWKTKQEDLGSILRWGLNDVLVIDSLSGAGQAALNWQVYKNNRAAYGPRLREFGLAMDDLGTFLEMISRPALKCHVLVITHLSLIGPKEPMAQSGEDELNEKLREQFVKTSEFIPTRYYPTALGRKLPPEVLRAFPLCVLAEAVQQGSAAKRQLYTGPRAEFDVKVPFKGVRTTLPIETGLLDIFKAAGHNPPGLS